jgi:hypothetical protein
MNILDLPILLHHTLNVEPQLVELKQCQVVQETAYVFWWRLSREISPE